MWSKWQWVMRIASVFAPVASIAARIRSASSPGSTTSSRSEPARRSRKQFSATGPTVSISTSRAIRPPILAAGGDPGSLPPPLHRHVDVVAGGDVEDQHEETEEERAADAFFEDQDQGDGEDDGGDESADEGAAPGRRHVLFRGRFAFGAGAGLGFLAAAGAAAAGSGVDAAALGPAALALSLFLRLGHGNEI